MTYAPRTTVSVDRSKAEIEKLLHGYGATAFGRVWDQHAAVVVFEISGRRIMMRVPMPDRDAHKHPVPSC